MIKPRKKYRRRFLVVGRKPIEEYSVVITSGGNGSVTVDGVTGDYVATVPDGTVLTVSATADAHYGFTAWSDGETDNPRTITVTGDLNLTASFAIDTYIVNVIAGANGSVSVNGTVGNYSQLVAYGTQLEIAATPAMGYDFTAWSDGVSSTTRTVTVTGDVTLSAAFAIQTFTVSISAGANGSVSVNGTPGDYLQTVNYGTALVLEATPSTGYDFTMWSDGDGNSQRIIAVTGDVTLSAAFAIQTFSVSVTAGQNGSVSVNGVSGNYSQTVSYGTVLTVEATGNTGYSFTQWSDGSSANPRTVTVTSDLSLTSAYAIQTFSVSLSAGANGSISVNGTPVVGTYTDTVSYGTTLTLEATGDTGYAFSQWSDGNSDNPRSLTVTSNTTLTASFQAAVQPADEIWYTSTNNQVVTPYGTNFGVVTMTSNTYSGGKGVIKLSGNLQTMAECFKNCTTLATMTLPTTMTQIGYDTFNGCTSLTGIDIPSNVTTIGQRCFNGCTNLASATIGSSVTTMSDDAFKDCSSLTSVVIPNSVTTLGTNVFMSCTDLASVTLGSGLTTLPENAFRVCTSLTSVTIPSSLTSIGNSVFTGCSTMSSITFQSTTTVPTIGTNAFNNVASVGTVYGQAGLDYSTIMAALPVGWSLVQPYAVTLSAGANGSISVNGTPVVGTYTDTVSSGTQLTLAATGDAGYTFTQWSDGNTDNPRTLTVTSDVTLTASFQAAVQPDYFYIENLNNSNLTANIAKSENGVSSFDVSYSTDLNTWTTEAIPDRYYSVININVPANRKVYIKANTDSWDKINIWCDANYNVGGNIMSLLYGDNFENKYTFPTGSVANFYKLFSRQYITNYLISAADLRLPATTLTLDCYMSMFENCTTLTQPPALPSTMLFMQCYLSMFRGCTSLTTAPALPATTLHQNCYAAMFYGCTSLSDVTIYADDISAGYCLNDWLNGVAATGTFHNLGSATYPSGASGIPSGWTEVTS